MNIESRPLWKQCTFNLFTKDIYILEAITLPSEFLTSDCAYLRVSNLTEEEWERIESAIREFAYNR